MGIVIGSQTAEDYDVAATRLLPFASLAAAAALALIAIAAATADYDRTPDVALDRPVPASSASGGVVASVRVIE